MVADCPQRVNCSCRSIYGLHHHRLHHLTDPRALRARARTREAFPVLALSRGDERGVSFSLEAASEAPGVVIPAGG